VINWLKSNWDIVLTILTGPIGAIILVIRRFRDEILGFFGNILSFMAGVGSSIVNFFQELPGKVASAVARFTTSVLTGLANFGKNVFDNVVGTLATLPSQVAFLLGFMVGRVLKILFFLPFYAKKFFTEFVDTAVRIAAKFGDAVFDKIKGFSKALVTELIKLPAQVKNIFTTILTNVNAFVTSF